MLTDDEILGLWSEGKVQKPLRPVLGSKKIIEFAHAIEREAYRRAALVCKEIEDGWYDNDKTAGLAWECVVALEALGREE